jgi:hypothetical protein
VCSRRDQPSRCPQTRGLRVGEPPKRRLRGAPRAPDPAPSRPVKPEKAPPLTHPSFVGAPGPPGRASLTGPPGTGHRCQRPTLKCRSLLDRNKMLGLLAAIRICPETASSDSPPRPVRYGERADPTSCREHLAVCTHRCATPLKKSHAIKIALCRYRHSVLRSVATSDPGSS